MLNNTLNIRKPSRGITRAIPSNLDTEKEAAPADTFELASFREISREALRDTDKISHAMRKSTRSGSRSSFHATVTANLVGGVAGATLVRDLAILRDKTLLEIDFKKKPSARSIRENIKSADWVSIKNFDRAGKSHESEIMKWQLERDGHLDAERGNDERVVLSTDDDSVVVHGWSRNTDNTWARYVRGHHEPEKDNTFFPSRVEFPKFGLKVDDWASFESSGLSYEQWADQRIAGMEQKNWAYTRKLEAQKSTAPSS